MERKTQSGYLMLADISGFTSFVANTEIEHAEMALTFLLETIVEKLSMCLTISKLEGDAVFAYCEESSIPKGKTLMQLIDQVYLAFRDKAAALYA
jgi:sulfate adenylyltransferase subunit 1 (EFTu-like GTPase family)